jgi:hypothetical protein
MNQEVELFNVVLKCKYKEVYKVKGEEESGYGFTKVEKKRKGKRVKGIPPVTILYPLSLAAQIISNPASSFPVGNLALPLQSGNGPW